MPKPNRLLERHDEGRQESFYCHLLSKRLKVLLRRFQMQPPLKKLENYYKIHKKKKNDKV